MSQKLAYFTRSHSQIRIDHFAVDCWVIWPLNGNEAAGDLDKKVHFS